jgi:hypothetical protein
MHLSSPRLIRLSLRTRSVLRALPVAIGVAAACSANEGGQTAGSPYGGTGGSGGGASEDASVDTSIQIDVEQPDAPLNVDGACVADVTETVVPPVDIVFVVDTSGSMSTEIAAVQANINAFSSRIGQSGLDYRVIMIGQKGTTGIAICVPPPLGGPDCANLPPRFYHVNQVIGSNDALSKILSTFDSDDPAISWKKFTRFDSHKVFIVLTDDNSLLAHQSFDAQLLAKTPRGIFGDATRRRYTFQSICGWEDGTPVLTGPKCSTAVNGGLEYQSLSVLTGGIVESVCKTDYSSVLMNLARGITNKLVCELDLVGPDDAPVDPDKVAVRFTPDGEEGRILNQVGDSSTCDQVTEGWHYDDPDQPSRIVLCPETCEALNSSVTGALELLTGCAVPPPL